MGIELDKKTKKNVLETKRIYITPKSIRLKKSDLDKLEIFKDKLKDLTLSDFCSDTQAFRVLLSISKHSSCSLIKKALSETM